MRRLPSYLYPVALGIILLLIGLFVTEYFQLAYDYPGFDKLLHTTGGFIAAWFVATLVGREIGLMRPWVAGLALIGAVALIGVLWEFAEYSAQWVRYAHPVFYHYFHGGDLTDTLGDLLADLAGGASFALLCTPILTKRMGVLSSKHQSK